jgi:hypothetical protein
MWHGGAVRFPGARLLAVVLAVVLAGGTVAVARDTLAPAPAAGAAPGPVDIYGDSVVDGGSQQIAQRLRAAGWTPRIKSIPGVAIEQVAAAVMAQSHVSDVVVLGLGYSYFWKPVQLRREIDAVMFALNTRGVRRVIWLNTRENRPERRDVNHAIAQATRRWGNLEIADWNGLSRGRASLFEADGHHLAPAGGREMGDLIVRRLAVYLVNGPLAPLPQYGRRMAARAAVEGYGSPDPLHAAPRSRRSRSASPLVGLASTSTGRGYWIARRNGAVGAFGDARRHGDASGLPLRQPIVGMAATRSGRGYWLVASDGGVFAFGDARFHGSTGAIRLTQPVIGMMRTPRGRGYWLVAADGGVFSFGDAQFFGSTGGIVLDDPIVGMAPHPSGRGYWLVSYDGGIFNFGAARFHGSGATTPRYWKIVAMDAAGDGRGYWLLAANGEVLRYGSAGAHGWQPTITSIYYGIARRPGGGYWLAAQGAP